MQYELNKQTNTYEIADFDNVIESVKKFIETEGHLSLIVNDADARKLCWQSRTVLNKKVDEVATLRKELNKALLGKFNEQAKIIENLIKDASETLTTKIKEYDESLGKPKVLKLEISTFEKTKIDKVKEFALSLGCEVKIK